MRGAPFEPDEPTHVVGKVGYANLGTGPGDADGADAEVHPPLPTGKDKLDRRADPGTRGIGLLLRFHHGLPRQFAEQPDRPGARNPVVRPQAAESHEQQVVADLEFGLVVRKHRISFFIGIENTRIASRPEEWRRLN